MALKWLLFSEKSQKLPSGWGLSPQAPNGVNCYLARNLHNQQLSKLLQWNSVNKFTVNKSSRLLHSICLERNRPNPLLKLPFIKAAAY